jgi:ribosomal-protein-alanine N-acetyltransferase
MSLPEALRTDRLLLRRWRARDREAYAALAADPRVMRHFGTLLTRAESDAHADRIEAHFAAHGFGVWALEVPGVAEFAGFAGLAHADFAAPFNPSIEIAWRLAPELQGRGYASEAARAALRFGFEQLGLVEILAFTTPANLASQRVMERLGIQRDRAGDFAHPALPAGDPLRSHLLYRARA